MRAPRLRLLALCLALSSVVHASEIDTARALADRKDYAGAIPAYERALARQPGDSDLMIELAQVYGWADRNRDSAALYRRVLSKHPDRRDDVVPSLAWQTLWAGSPKDAVPLFREALRKNRGDVESAVGLSEALRDSGDATGALAQLDTILAAHPGQVRALNARGELRLDRGANELALNDFDATLRSAPGDVDARVGRAKALDALGRHRAAVQEYRALGARLPHDEGVRLKLARSFYWAGAEAEALDALRGLTIPEAQPLRDRIAREGASRATAGYEISHDSDDLKIQSALVQGRYRIGRTGAIDADYRSTWLQGTGTARSATVASAGAIPTTPGAISSRIRGDALVVAYSDRFGSVDAPYGLVFPRLGVGARRYSGWTSPAMKLGARWLATDSWRYDFEAGNEVVETVDALANRVRFDYAGAGFDHVFAPRWNVGASYLRGRFNDRTSRDRLTGVLERLITDEPRLTVGLEGLAMRDSRQATQDVSNVVAGPAGATTVFSIPGRGYYNPRRYWEAKAFGTYGVERDRWSLSTKLALGGLGETTWDGASNRGLYTFAELNGLYRMARDIDVRLQAGRSGSRLSASESGGYHRAYGGMYLDCRF